MRAGRPQWVGTSRLLLLAVAALAVPGAAAAQSPLVAELERVATRYHENPARLDAIRTGLVEALKTDSHVDNVLALARVSFLWGDIRATTTEEKLEAYDQGREAGRRAVELAPRRAATHFWYAVNTARWGQTKGIVRSLFLLSTIQDGIKTVLELDPNFTAVYSLAGNVDYEVPALLGGSLDRAEELFRKGLAQDPRFTGLRVGLAKTLVRKKRYAEARRELRGVLDERAPTNLADWTLKDAPAARTLLDAIKNR